MEAAALDSAAAYQAWRAHTAVCRECRFSEIHGLCRQGRGLQAWILEAELADGAELAPPNPYGLTVMDAAICGGGA
jgi:hypothetical protein